MNKNPKRRGRPKGTGIDDTATLTMIAELIAVDHGLKPTSAIRRLGVSDPSVVRRLRDKLKATPAAIPAVKTVKKPARRPSPLPLPPEPQSTSTITPTPDVTPLASLASPAGVSPTAASLLDPQLEAMRLAAEAAAATSRLYLHCMTYAAHTNPMSLALRSQIAMSQWLSGLLTPPQPLQKASKSDT